MLGRPKWVIAALAVFVAGLPADAAQPSKLAPASLGETPGLVEYALRAMNGEEEIVFAVRPLYKDGHYYANFGHWSHEPDRWMHAP